MAGRLRCNNPTTVNMFMYMITFIMASSREVVTEDKKRLKNEKDELETKFDKSSIYSSTHVWSLQV